MIPFKIHLNFYHYDRIDYDALKTLTDNVFEQCQSVIRHYDIQVSVSMFWFYPDDESEQAGCKHFGVQYTLQCYPPKMNHYISLLIVFQSLVQLINAIEQDIRVVLDIVDA